ncbi:hypothetical protein PUN28_013005 [Cardiocondyla obscurior]|uniref:Secreted protein n=1 Tax=Cardiocondyla obscurior TaxID=286306 RepID=A0AAW2FC42_9HYME
MSWYSKSFDTILLFFFLLLSLITKLSLKRRTPERTTVNLSRRFFTIKIKIIRATNDHSPLVNSRRRNEHHRDIVSSGERDGPRC